MHLLRGTKDNRFSQYAGRGKCWRTISLTLLGRVSRHWLGTHEYVVVSESIAHESFKTQLRQHPLALCLGGGREHSQN